MRADTFGTGAAEFEIEFTVIGVPGNRADATAPQRPAGAVPYAYRISIYEISEAMVRAANDAGGLGISVSNRGPDMPATAMTWHESARFVNWLNADAGSSPAYKFSAAGAFELWSPADVGYDPDNLYRNRQAKYFLPSFDEWFKAAYYDPVADVYYDYPTGSNDVPDGLDFSGDREFEAVFDQSPRNILYVHGVDDVGVMNAFGVAGMGGNVWEWEETSLGWQNLSPTELRYVAGGGASNPSGALRRSVSFVPVTPGSSSERTGFRVASWIPEPESLALAAVATIAAIGSYLMQFKRRRSAA